MCGCCPGSSRNSTLIRIIYAVILLLGTIVACIMLSPGVDQQLRRVQHSDTVQNSTCHSNFTCFWLAVGVWSNRKYFHRCIKRLLVSEISWRLFFYYLLFGMLMLYELKMWLLTVGSRLLWRRGWPRCPWLAGWHQLWDICGLQGSVPSVLRHEHMVSDFLCSSDQYQEQQRPPCCHT